MARLHVLRVFCDADGEWGNPLGVFLADEEVPEAGRQAVATELGFSETVFVDDTARGECRIFTPGSELPFAGHPMVGTAWLLAWEGHRVEVLRPPAGEIAVHREGELTWIAARAEWSPPWALIELSKPGAVASMTAALPGEGMAYCWAWIDEGAGIVRSRCFPPAEGITEDEATGSAAVMLTARLERALTIHQGEGSELFTRPLGDGRAEVGGRVVLDEVREHPV